MLNEQIEYYIEEGKSFAKFNGVVYAKEDSGYYRQYVNWGAERNSVRLHRAVYEYYKGKIKKKHHIHHKDGDKENNDIENLEMVSSSKHNEIHFTEERKEIAKKNYDKAREAAIRWHKTSPLSSMVHSKAAKLGWEDRPYYKHVCKQCGKEFQTREKSCGFCCGKCKNDYALGYSLVEIESIEYIGKRDVYNMEVEKYHNYSVEGGHIIHNCDAIRYYVNTILKLRILRLK